MIREKVHLSLHVAKENSVRVLSCKHALPLKTVLLLEIEGRYGGYVLTVANSPIIVEWLHGECGLVFTSAAVSCRH